MTEKGLTGNQLKLIAMITMTMDHMGLILFPNALWLRIVGRLAMPLYAFCIGEGCLHSRSLPKYLGSVALMGVICQVVAFVGTGTLYQNILMAFSLSILLAMLLRWAQKRNTVAPWVAFGVAVAAVLFITEGLPYVLTGTDYQVDYGFWGVMLPLAVMLGKNRVQQLLLMSVPLLFLSVGNPAQGFALAALPILIFYSGERGSRKLKWVFYFYYPAHLAVLYLILFFL